MRTLRLGFLALALFAALPLAPAAAEVPDGAPVLTLVTELAMPTYDPTTHPRLSTEAAALSPEALAAFADEAEALFGIADTDFVEQDAADLTAAVVRQVNLTVRLEAMGGGAHWSESKGDQNVSVARDIRTGRPVLVDAIAQQIVDRVKARGAAAAGTPDLPLASGSTPIQFSW